MPEPEICMSKKSTDRIWKYLEKEYTYSDSLIKLFTNNEDSKPWIHVWDHVAASSSRLEGKAPLNVGTIETGFNTMNEIKNTYDLIFNRALQTTRRSSRTASQPVYLYQAERLANILIEKTLPILEEAKHMQDTPLNIQTHMTMRAFRIGGTEGTLHAVVLILNIDVKNNTYHLDIFDPNGEHRPLFYINDNSFVCYVKDITSSFSGYDIIKPNLSMSKSQIHDERMKVVNWFKEHISTYPTSAVSYFGLIDICLSKITLPTIKKNALKIYSTREIPNKLDLEYVELQFDDYNALAFTINSKYFILTRKEKRVKRGAVNPITEFIETRHYEVFMLIFINILNKKINDLFLGKKYNLRNNGINSICDVSNCNDGLNLRGSGCNTWSLFYHWIRVKFPIIHSNNILKKIVSLSDDKVSQFEKKIFIILNERDIININRKLYQLIEDFLNVHDFIIKNETYYTIATKFNCLLGGSQNKKKKK
jgi:hypothetical protein